MTSGIPTYDDSDATLATIAEVGLGRHVSPAVLVGFAAPTYPGAPKPTSGYAYSNTNCILAGMIVEKATGRSVQAELEDRFLGERYGLTSTYYRAVPYPPEVTDRMASGYFADPEMKPMAKLIDTDMKTQDMSWAGAAGALVSRPEDVNRWARGAFAPSLAPRRFGVVVSSNPRAPSRASRCPTSTLGPGQNESRPAGCNWTSTRRSPGPCSSGLSAFAPAERRVA